MTLLLLIIGLLIYFLVLLSFRLEALRSPNTPTTLYWAPEISDPNHRNRRQCHPLPLGGGAAPRQTSKGQTYLPISISEYRC